MLDSLPHEPNLWQGSLWTLLRRFVETGPVAVFDGRHYLSELGMRRAANMSRVLPGIIKSRHGPYLNRWYREHEQRHNDGVNRLVVQFAREGVEAVAGWRSEANVPGLTQVRPDLLVQVSEGDVGGGNPLHRIRAPRRAAMAGSGEAGTLPAHGCHEAPVTSADGMRDAEGGGEFPRGQGSTAHVDRPSGTGLRRAAAGGSNGVAQERRPGRAAVRTVIGSQTEGVQGRFGIPFTKIARPVRTPHGR